VFNFDWNPNEDTTTYDINPLYQKKHEAKILFGRGHIGGIETYPE